MTNEQAKMSLSEILEKTKDSLIISDAFTKADSVLNHKGYKKRVKPMLTFM